MIKRITFVLSLLLLQAAMSQTLRPSHWSDAYIRFLQTRGYLWQLSPLSRPLTAADVQKALSAELTSPTQASAVAYERSLNLITCLQHEGLRTGSLLIGAQSDERYVDDRQDKHYAGVHRLHLGVQLRPWLQLYNVMVADSRLDNQPDYLGIQQNGFAGYTEQAFLRLYRDGLEFKIGRDFLRLGPGHDAALFISDHSRPLDQVMLSFRQPWFIYQFFVATLDPSRYMAAGAVDRQNRYLSGHRLEVRPWRFLSAALQEAVIYGGMGAGMNLAYCNPFAFFHAEQMNGPDPANTLGSVQLAIKPARNWLFYADLLIDDLQVENSGPGDREPAEWGYLLGVDWSDPFWLRGLDLFAEYTAVANRTYNTVNPWEKWLHRRLPLGHFLGNDFTRLLSGLSYWPVSAWRLSITYEHRRKGEGRIEAEFDEPWLDLPKGENYHEPFPFGVVESLDLLTLDLSWQPRWGFCVFGHARHTRASNWSHQSGAERSFWQGQAGVSLDLFKPIRMP